MQQFVMEYFWFMFRDHTGNNLQEINRGHFWKICCFMISKTYKKFSIWKGLVYLAQVKNGMKRPVKKCEKFLCE